MQQLLLSKQTSILYHCLTLFDLDHLQIQIDLVSLMDIQLVSQLFQTLRKEVHFLWMSVYVIHFLFRQRQLSSVNTLHIDKFIDFSFHYWVFSSVFVHLGFGPHS